MEAAHSMLPLSLHHLLREIFFKNVNQIKITTYSYKKLHNNNNNNNNNKNGARSGVVVKALRYKPASRGFDSRWCYWNFSVT
jgi:hypothetical protein